MESIGVILVIIILYKCCIIDIKTTIGFTGVKSSSVHFYVFRKGHYRNQGLIRFENEILNVGKGFDWKNQWFVAPYSGIYFISVSGTKDRQNSEPVIIHALLNEEQIVEVLCFDEKNYDPFSFQLSKNLKPMIKSNCI